ncbi:pantetheine-phosphate adenylyltransferase family protein-like protein [Rhizodiscina lignyota]|uniref:Pantetheine-phosphate adenylyltransferase family protein-like protein n=1 Tax=Rhizodiscina lignyota TaxID=1504668 RepID=A0A9P4IM86_9PEZI|nr:pantetheine-phosphate adenylyltransferase family protein-like protein [Rhizodiscina lignyota]
MALESLPLQCLLLLSPSPSPATFANVKATYHTPLFSVLRELNLAASSTFNGKKILDIALPCPHLYTSSSIPRSCLYDETQRVLANVYKLITVISTTQGISLESGDGIDVRVILISWPRDDRVDLIQEGTAGDDLTGPVINIRTLASSRRPWNTIYSIQTEQGEQVLKTFLHSGQGYNSVTKVRGGITAASTASSAAGLKSAEGARRHYSVAVGGTFDHLHIGHKLLLTMFAFMADEDPLHDSLGGPEKSLTVGITAGELLKNKKYAEFLESWDARQKSTWDFFCAILHFSRAGPDAVRSQEITDDGPNGHAVHYKLLSGLVIKLVEIWDPFGPTITDESISALVISAETRSGGKAVNDKRREKGWAELEVFEVDVLDAEEESELHGNGAEQTFQSKLSSTEIRRMQSEKARREYKV